MREPPDQEFKPAKLKAWHFERPVTRKMRCLPNEELQKLHAEREALHEHFNPFGERLRKRAGMYVLGAVVFFPLMNWFLTPVGFQALWFQILVSIVYGIVVAYWRPNATQAALLTLMAGYAIMAVTGQLNISLSLMLSTIFYVCFGAAIGITESSKYMDGQ